MPAVDRNLLRIGVFELLWVDEIDDPVAITEAVELARSCPPTTRRGSSTACSSRIADIADHLRATPLTRLPRATRMRADRDLRATVDSALGAASLSRRAGPRAAARPSR